MYCQDCGENNMETSIHCIRCGFDMVNQKRSINSTLKTTEKEKPAKFNWWWPDVSTVEIAKKAVDGGFWAATLISVLTALITTIALYSDTPELDHLGLKAWAFMDAALFAWIAYGLHQHSRVAAVAGLLLFCLEKYDQLANGTVVNTMLMVAIIFAFIGAIRGTFALQRLKSKA